MCKNGVCLASTEVLDEILRGFYHRSKQILEKGFIEKQYREFAETSREAYLRTFAGFGKWLSRIDRYLFDGLLVKRKYNEGHLLAMRNFIECEAHRELVLEGLKGEVISGKE